MREEFRKGNIGRKAGKIPSRKDWFLGHFIKRGSPFHTTAFELKWCDCKKGWKKVGTRKDITKTLLILISGRFRVTFTETENSCILSKKGDFLYYQSKPHLGEALKDSLLLVVRWPSIKA
jgi:hypothetical protein